MLIRFVVDNVYSFGEEREFNMLPQPRLRTLDHHKYNVGGLDLVKLSAIYGSNGAGKSNLVKAISLLQEIVLERTIPYKMEKARFKFRAPELGDRQFLAVQFVQDDIPFYYGLEIKDKVVSCEELYVSGLGKKDDKLIFERTIDPEGKPQLKFNEKFEAEAESQTYKKVLLQSFVKPTESIFFMLSEHDSPFLKEIRIAIKWFLNSLVILTPEMKPKWLPQLIDEDPLFSDFADTVMRSYDLGIEKLVVEKHKRNRNSSNTQAFEQMMEEVGQAPLKMISKATSDAGVVVFKLEGEDLTAKSIKVIHSANGVPPQVFDLEEESDGTNRLLDLIPLLKGIANHRVVYLVDEIERSLHPNMIKEIVTKFALDEASQGQLIFTTHESNLLDQGILRQDEIWFVEKDERGCSDMYSLSDYKEHNTIDIRKGYLQGRYGGVPFLGNLHDLNWHGYAAQV